MRRRNRIESTLEDRDELVLPFSGVDENVRVRRPKKVYVGPCPNFSWSDPGALLAKPRTLQRELAWILRKVSYNANKTVRVDIPAPELGQRDRSAIAK